MSLQMYNLKYVLQSGLLTLCAETHKIKLRAQEVLSDLPPLSVM